MPGERLTSTPMSTAAPPKRQKKRKPKKTASTSLGVAPPSFGDDDDGRSFCKYLADETVRAREEGREADTDLAPLEVPADVAAHHRAATSGPPKAIPVDANAKPSTGVDYGKWDDVDYGSDDESSERHVPDPRAWERTRKPVGREETWDEKAMRELSLKRAVEKGCALF